MGDDGDDLTPSDLATLDQGHALYCEILATEVETAREAVERHGLTLGMAVVARAILDDSQWDRELLVMVLSAALVERARQP